LQPITGEFLLGLGQRLGQGPNQPITAGLLVLPRWVALARIRESN